MSTSDNTGSPGADTAPDAASNFIHEKVERDLATDRFGGRVVTRFPPEPNGYLHIGHAKSIALNFSTAAKYKGVCHLRFDDTNPTTEDPEFVESIQRDVRWLGFDWGDNLFFASDYFKRLYEVARKLISDGKAYVCSLNEEEIRAYRGTVTEPGRPSPYRDRSVQENLDLFERMRAGEFEDGAHVLRAKADMASPNMKMRDPLLYRIRHAHHYRSGDAWPIYPMYDFAHPLSDAFERITHSLCTLEFENNRELYDWVVTESQVEAQPEQTEFARLNLTYTVMSKRKLATLVSGELVKGWDDPRMPTLAGMRRRGISPEAIREFCERIGVAKANSTVDVAQLESCVRDDLNFRAPRVLAVLDPLRVVIENYPEGQSEQLEAPYFPHDIPKEGSRELPFSRVLYIERDDFREQPPKGYHRLAPGREVRLRYAYVIRCEQVVKDEKTGEVVELRCSYDPATRGGNTPDGRKVKGTIHWVSAEHALQAEARVYDRLFLHEKPDLAEAELPELLNPDSLIVTSCWVEPSLTGSEAGSCYQFERQGYFSVDPDSNAERLVFNRTVALRDSWTKQEKKKEQKPAKSPGGPPKARAKGKAEKQRATLSTEQQAVVDRYRNDQGLPEEDARILALYPDLAQVFDAALPAAKNAKLLANWVVNDLRREVKDKPITTLPFGDAELGELVALIDAGTISNTIAKDLFVELVRAGGSPRAMVESRNLGQVSDEAELAAVVEQILADEAESVERYRQGKTNLLGFFVGRVMRATGGKANPGMVNQILRSKLG